MKFSHALILACSLAFFACGDDDDDDSPASPAKESSKKDDSKKDVSDYDCTVKGGVKVVYPAGGETFKMGDKITVIYGSDIKGSGFRFKFKTSEDDEGIDMLEGSAGPEDPDGKTCYEQEVELTEDYAEPTSTAIIRVIPYERTSKAGNSGTFKVKD